MNKVDVMLTEPERRAITIKYLRYPDREDKLCEEQARKIVELIERENVYRESKNLSMYGIYITGKVWQQIKEIVYGNK